MPQICTLEVSPSRSWSEPGCMFSKLTRADLAASWTLGHLRGSRRAVWDGNIVLVGVTREEPGEAFPWQAVESWIIGCSPRHCCITYGTSFLFGTSPEERSINLKPVLKRKNSFLLRNRKESLEPGTSLHLFFMHLHRDPRKATLPYDHSRVVPKTRLKNGLEGAKSGLAPMSKPHWALSKEGPGLF